MSAWWNNLSARERIMLAIAASLAGVLLVTFAILRPLADLRANADQRAKAARSGYELTATAAAVAGGTASGAEDNQTPLRQAVIATASAAGIELIRIGTETDGQLEIQAAQVSGDVFFAWLSQLQTTYGASIAFADIARGEAGLVNPQVLVLERK
ncbi:type II secretion system protein GspM [Hyphococcus sp.]|uniref:type II secretion system protein GspM n=1 Tax=Hyphococcus sp. TaxID=2038636 RepID=UPI00208AD064|nr:MAG: type II secretion system protein M [Marinicaulis sp.]